MADSDNESGGHKDHCEISQKEQDRFLPIANVSRIMKKALPANAKISKDAKETVQECVSVFLYIESAHSYITEFNTNVTYVRSLVNSCYNASAL